MGNTVSSNTTKLSYLYESCNDIFMQQMYSSVSKATCDIKSFQDQRVVISDAKLKNCKININQYTNALCNLVGLFNNTINNDAEIRSFVQSTVSSILNSTDNVIQSFIDTVGTKLPPGTVDTKAYIKNTVSKNLQVRNFASCTSSVFSVQKQTVILDGVPCIDGQITIDQSAVIKDYAKCFFLNVLDSALQDPVIRRGLRSFNDGIDESGDKVYGPLPDVCYSSVKNTNSTDSSVKKTTIITDTWLSWLFIILVVLSIVGLIALKLRIKLRK